MRFIMHFLARHGEFLEAKAGVVNMIRGNRQSYKLIFVATSAN